MSNRAPTITPGPDPELDQDLLRALLDVSELLVVVLDLDGRVVRFNRACEALTGFSAEEVIGQPIWVTLIPEDEAAAVQEVAHSLAEGRFPSTFVNHWRTRDGTPRLIHWHNTTLLDANGRPRRLLGTGIDITSQKRAEEVRLRGAVRLKELVNALPGLVARLDRNFRVRFANEAYRSWFGLDPEAQTGRHVSEVIGAEAFEVLRPHFEQALSGRQSELHGVVPYARGGTRFIHGTYIPSRDDADEIDGIYILALDISAQQALRRQLSTEMRRSRTVLENAIDGIIIINGRGTIEHFNPAAERIFGHAAADVIGRNVKVLVPEPDHTAHDDYIRRFLDTGDGRIIGSGREVVGRHRDGSPIDLRLAIAEFREDGKTFFVGFTSDISGRKAAERRAREHLQALAHLDRQAGLNELTAGLAHELSQPLTAIRATAEACLALSEADRAPADTLAKALEQISLQAARAAEIVQEVRTFLRKGSPDVSGHHDPAVLLDTVLKLLSHEIEAAAIQVVRQQPDAVRSLAVNRVQIEQVLFNLIRNAIQAMAGVDGPRILSLTTRIDPEAMQCRIEVADTGGGIDAEHLDRLFEPFFTTRPEGLGQGLSICRSIVLDHSGTLTAENHPEGGALFRLGLPLSKEGAPDGHGRH